MELKEIKDVVLEQEQIKDYYFLFLIILYP